MPKPIDREQLVDLFCQHFDTGYGAEIGVFKGVYAETILNKWPGTLLLVDTWRHMDGYLDSWNLSDLETQSNFEETKSRVGKFHGRFRMIRDESENAAAMVPNQSLDFVYIDANHAYRAVLRDLDIWSQKVRVGGIISGHDYFDALADDALEPDFVKLPKFFDPNILTSYGVKSAVNSYVSKNGYELHCTEEDSPSWWFRNLSHIS